MSHHLLARFNSINCKADLQQLTGNENESGEEESLYLEFKTIDTQTGTAKGSEPYRYQFAEILSAFANADGGILIWGVKTRKGDDGVDRAERLVPISNHAAICKSMMDAVDTSTQPRIDGVLVQAIPDPDRPDSGFIKCLIPASPKSPHRAVKTIRQIEQQYWRRQATGNRVMDHYELDDAFGRRPRPHLELEVMLISLDNDLGSGKICCQVKFRLRNTGHAIASRSSIFFSAAGDFENPAIIQPDSISVSMDWSEVRTQWFFHAQSSMDVHPMRVWNPWVLGPAFALPQNIPGTIPMVEDMRLQWSAENMRPLSGTVTLRLNEPCLVVPDYGP